MQFLFRVGIRGFYNVVRKSHLCGIAFACFSYVVRVCVNRSCVFLKLHFTLYIFLQKSLVELLISSNLEGLKNLKFLFNFIFAVFWILSASSGFLEART